MSILLSHREMDSFTLFMLTIGIQILMARYLHLIIIIEHNSIF